MYRISDIIAKLKNLVGWRQNYDEEEMSLPDDLTASESGVYVQDIHPMLTLENLRAIAPDYTQKDYDEWDEESEYKVGKVVKIYRENATEGVNEDYALGQDGYGLYRCIKACTGMNPEASAEYWEHVDLFGEWLRKKSNASLTKAITKFVADKAILNSAKTLLETKSLFNQAGRVTDVVRPTSSLVGFELVPARHEGVTLKIGKVGLQFNMNGAVKLYLYHSSEPDPLYTFELSYTKGGGMQWFDLADVALPYTSADTDTGGSWYLVYNQDELADGMKAINKERDWSKHPCKECSESEYLTWQAWSRWLEVHPFKVKADGDTLWDVSKNLYTYTTNYGLNLQVSMVCDITDLIIDQRMIFANVVATQTAYDLLREMAYNPQFRINRVQQNLSSNDILYELDGDSTSNKKSGLGYQLEQMYKELDVNTDGLSEVCLPCKSKGIRYRSI